jgi:hypothetical protein
MHKIYLMLRQDLWLINVALFYALPWIAGVMALAVVTFQLFLRWLCGKKIYRHELIREIEEAYRCRV